MAAIDMQDSNSGDWWDQNAASAQTPASPVIGPGGITLGQTIGTPWNLPTTPQYPGQPTVPNVTIGGQPIYSGSPASDSTFTGGDPGLTFGGPVAPFQFAPSGSGYPTFAPPPLPDALKTPWTLPTAADVQNTPGYQSRYLQGLDARQKAAASKGTILNGGTVKALDRYGTDYATQAYQQDVDNSLQQRQQAASDYLNLAYGPAWQQNQSAVNQYGQLYNQYKDLTSNNRLAQNDYWQQQMDLLNAGLGAAKAGTPGTAGASAG